MDEPEQTTRFENTMDQDDGPGIDKVVVTNLTDGSDFPLEVIVYDAEFNVVTTISCTGNGVFPMDLGTADRDRLVFSTGFQGSVGPGPAPFLLPCSCPTGFECQLPIPTGKASTTPVMNENRHIRVTITRIITDPKPIITTQEQKEMGG